LFGLSFFSFLLGNIAATAEDRGRGRGGAYDITPRKYLEEQSKYVLFLQRREGGREGGMEGENG
jgi:hypothetical protein